MEKIAFVAFFIVFFGIIFALGEHAITVFLIIIICFIVYACATGNNINSNQYEDEYYEEYEDENEDADFDSSGLPDHIRVPRR